MAPRHYSSPPALLLRERKREYALFIVIFTRVHVETAMPPGGEVAAVAKTTNK